MKRNDARLGPAATALPTAVDWIPSHQNQLLMALLDGDVELPEDTASASVGEHEESQKREGKAVEQNGEKWL